MGGSLNSVGNDKILQVEYSENRIMKRKINPFTPFVLLCVLHTDNDISLFLQNAPTNHPNRNTKSNISNREKSKAHCDLL